VQLGRSKPLRFRLLSFSDLAMLNDIRRSLTFCCLEQIPDSGQIRRTDHSPHLFFLSNSDLLPSYPLRSTLSSAKSDCVKAH
jgi:hypothetical protein